MNSSVTVSLDTRRTKKDDTFPVVLRISHGRRTINIATGYSVQEKYWDSRNRKIKGACNTIDNVGRANNFILKKRSDAADLIAYLDSQNKLETVSALQIKEKLKGKSSKLTFFTYTQQLIDTFKSTGRLGNARSYSDTLRAIKNFHKNVDFRIEEVSYEFLKNFENDYLSRGNDINGLAVYMRTIRAIFNYAIKDNIVDKNHYPFDDYTIRTKPTSKRAIPFESIAEIVNLKLDLETLILARNIFLTSFYSMGAPFVDIVFWKKSNIAEGRLKYKRRKTGKLYNIKITPQLEKILSHYLKGKKDHDFIFPVITTETPEEQYNQELWALQRYNKKLKKIAKLAGIQENLTSYVSRHSFATLANNKGVPVTAISSMLGHGDLRTTETYLASLNNDVIDEFNAQIINGD